jgi:hypothetical protein
VGDCVGIETKKVTYENGGTVMQKAMEMKQRKNLELIKGNSFVGLQVDYLNQIAHDANIRIGCHNNENEMLIDNLVNAEKSQYDQFVNENPDIILFVNLDIALDVLVEPFKDPTTPENMTTHVGSLKELDISTLWTEVDMSGRNRNKTRSINDKNNSNDRCCLEYYGFEQNR